MFEIVLKGLMGGLVAGFAILVARALVNPKEKPGAYRALMGFLFLCSFYAADQTLAPQARAWKRAYDVDQFLKRDPLYSLLLADNPTLREPLQRAVVKALEPGQREQGRAAIRELVATVLPTYLPRASDEALVNFVRQLTRTLRTLASADPDRCYRYLFPKVSGPANLGKDDGLEELDKAVRGVVESALSRPLQPLERSGPDSTLEDVVARLATRYGNDVRVLQRPEAPGVDRAKVCALSIDLYSEVLSLPTQEAGRVLRFLFSQ